MSVLGTPKAPDQAEASPLPSDVKKIAAFGGIQEIITKLQKGEWVSWAGAIMTFLKEWLGTPEEQKAIAEARQEAKEDNATRETKEGLQTLQEDVDDTKKEEPEAEVVPYEPGTKKPTISPKHVFAAQVKDIYALAQTKFTTANLHEYFGKNYKKFLIERDPVTDEEPISFLGRPISGGVNLMMLPFLKIAEEKIRKLNLNYIPAQKEIRGFQDRNMCVADGKGGLMYDPNIPSFHKYGLAVDLDPDFNWPKDGRGDIPDEVMIVMAEAGFNLGCMGDETASHYLINDLMHFQLRFPPGSSAGQKIIEASTIGRKYWKAVSPMLDALKLTS